MDPIAVQMSPVLMGRAEFGLLGHYNKYKKSPFGTFDVGGDGMTGYSSYATESIALRGYENSSLLHTVLKVMPTHVSVWN